MVILMDGVLHDRFSIDGFQRHLSQVLNCYKNEARDEGLPAIDVVVLGVDEVSSAGIPQFPLKLTSNVPLIHSQTGAVLVNDSKKAEFNVGRGADLTIKSSWTGSETWRNYWRWIGRGPIKPPVWATQPSFAGFKLGE